MGESEVLRATPLELARDPRVARVHDERIQSLVGEIGREHREFLDGDRELAEPGGQVRVVARSGQVSLQPFMIAGQGLAGAGHALLTADLVEQETVDHPVDVVLLVGGTQPAGVREETQQAVGRHIGIERPVFRQVS